MQEENHTQEDQQKVSGKPTWERWVSCFFSGLLGTGLAFCVGLALNLEAPLFFVALIASGLVIGSLLGYRFTWLADFLLAILHVF